MATQALPITRLINVAVILAPPAAAFPNLNTALVLGTSTVIDVTERMREYGDLDAVSADFGTTVEEYFAAQLWFTQSPQPTSLNIGRWAKTASAGKLVGGAVSAANQLISAWTAISAGSIRMQIDGGSVQNLTGLNFGAVTNLNGVASVIGAALTGATIVWNSVYSRFEVTSATTGASSVVAFAAAVGSGTDISTMASLRSTSSGAYQANGIVAESALAAVTILDNRFSSQWYGLVIPSAVDADHLAVAGFVEADSPAHFYGLTTAEAGVLVPGDTGNIAYLLQQLGYNHTMVQYSSSNSYAVISALARILTTNWGGSNTTITLKFKNEPGVVAESLPETQANALEAANCNVFVAYNNNTSILEQGICPSGQFVDTVIGVDWLRGAIQTNIYNLLIGSTTKIPQTDGGMHQIATQIEAACQQGVNNGLLAPGTWTSGGFGQIGPGSFLDKGFYIYTPPISSQAEADRAARASVPFQVAVKLAGAVHDVSVTVSVNQ